MRMLLSALVRFEHARHAELLERVQPIDEEVGAAPRMGWVPFEVNYQMTLALEQIAGREDMLRFFRGAFVNVWGSSLLRALTEFVLRLTGKDIQVAARNFGRGFPQLFRELGTWSVIESERGRVLTEFSGFPDRLFDDDEMWLHSVQGSLSSLFDYAELEGEVSMVETAQTAGANRALFLLQTL